MASKSKEYPRAYREQAPSINYYKQRSINRSKYGKINGRIVLIIVRLKKRSERENWEKMKMKIKGKEKIK